MAIDEGPRRSLEEQLVQAQKPAEALPAEDRALTVAKATGDRAGEAQALRGRALLLQQLGRMYRALAALRKEVLPVNPRQYAVFAEGYVDQIRDLQAEIDAYLGLDESDAAVAAFLFPAGAAACTTNFSRLACNDDIIFAPPCPICGSPDTVLLPVFAKPPRLMYSCEHCRHCWQEPNTPSTELH